MNSARQSFWARHSLPLAAVVIVIVSALGFGLDWLLVSEGLPRKDMMLFSNLLTGVFAGWLFYSFAQHERHRHDLIRERMRTIAELNHHIRNALQVIKYWGGSSSHVDSMQLQLINESVDRIEWALREVLPKYPAASTDPLPESPHAGFSSNVVNDLISERKQAGPH